MQGQTDRPIRVVIAARGEMRRSLRDLAGRAGLEIAAECVDGGELVAAVARSRPDLCLLDRDLHGGYLAATAAIATPPRAPRVIIVGGRVSPVEVRAARLAGAIDCLPISIGADELAAAAAAVVGRTSQFTSMEES
jgi:DNA-binding NarL/FixJ family response regulator